MNDFVRDIRLHFDAIASHVLGQLLGDEAATLNLNAEESLFLRFNRNRVRQNTDVHQIGLSLQLQSQGRTLVRSCMLTGLLDADTAKMESILQACRAEVPQLDIDPHQVPIENHGNCVEEFVGALLPAAELVPPLLEALAGCDMAGLYAGGVVIRANRNSAGQNHWFATESFFLDYSLYNGQKAAKGVYAGTHWDTTQWASKVQRTKVLLDKLLLPTVNVVPGQYRTYLAPRAFADLLGMLGWNAMSAAAWKQGRSPFKKLVEGDLKLSPLLSFGENFGLALCPRFNSVGEVSEATVPLVESGQLRSLLVSARSAKEYGFLANGADGREAPRALDVVPGTLAESDILSALGTGLYLSNLHYLNWSDPVSARVTGMTRFACFWVENGEIVGPINDLRWDESLFDALGEKLLALTDWAEVDPETQTYNLRALGGARIPGALIDGWTFTL